MDWIKNEEYGETRDWIEARGGSTSWNCYSFNDLDQDTEAFEGDYIFQVGSDLIGVPGYVVDLFGLMSFIRRG